MIWVTAVDTSGGVFRALCRKKCFSLVVYDDTMIIRPGVCIRASCV